MSKPTNTPTWLMPLVVAWLLWLAIPSRHRPYLVVIAATMGVGRWYLGTWWGPALVLAGLWLMKLVVWSLLRWRAIRSTGSPGLLPWEFPLRFVVEWWRKGRVTRQWRRLCEREKWFERRNEKPLRLRVRATPAGDLTGLCAPGGVALRKADIEASALRLRDTIGCREVAVRDHPNPKKVGSLVISFFYTDPLGRTLTIQDLPMPPEPERLPDGRMLQRFVVYGVREDGKPAIHDTELSMLVVGMPGMGKSSLAWTELCHHIREDIWTWVFAGDLKGGMEMGALRRTKDRQFPNHKNSPVVSPSKKDGGGQPDGEVDNPKFLVRGYTRTVTETDDMLAGLVTVLEHRQRYMDDHGLRKHVPTAAAPKIIVILDEFLMLKAQCLAGATSDLGVLLTQGRAAGIVIIGLAQTGHASELGVIRNFFPIRRVFAMPTPTATQTAIGGTEADTGAFCSKLSEVRDRGICYAISEGARRAQRERVAFVSDKPYPGEPEDGDSDLTLIARGLLPRGIRTAKDEPKRWCTYQFWGYEDKVTGGRTFIYVGKVDDRKRLERRMQEHRRVDAEWWHLVDESTLVVLDHATKREMLDAEQKMIKELKPTHNVHGQRNNPGQRRARRTAAQVAEKERVDKAVRDRREAMRSERDTTEGGQSGTVSALPEDYLTYGDRDRTEVDA